MFVKEKKSGDLIKVSQFDRLFSPVETEILGRGQAGEEEQDERPYSKEDLVFPSGEPLPRCWLDEKYKLRES